MKAAHWAAFFYAPVILCHFSRFVKNRNDCYNQITKHVTNQTGDFDFDTAPKPLQAGQPLSGKGVMWAPLIKQLNEADLATEQGY